MTKKFAKITAGNFLQNFSFIFFNGRSPVFNFFLTCLQEFTLKRILFLCYYGFKTQNT